MLVKGAFSTETVPGVDYNQHKTTSGAANDDTAVPGVTRGFSD